MQSASVRADIKKNRLYFKISGNLTKKKLDSLYTDVRFCVADLQPGFDIITDLSQCSLTSLSGLPTFIKISSYLINKEVGIVVRVINSATLVFLQNHNFMKRFQGYQALTVASLEEAEAALENAERHEDLRLTLDLGEISYTSGEQRGTASLGYLSTSGCSLQQVTAAVPVGQEIAVNCIFEVGEETRSFHLKGQVTHTDGAEIVLSFATLADDEKKALWNCMMKQAAKDIKL